MMESTSESFRVEKKTYAEKLHAKRRRRISKRILALDPKAKQAAGKSPFMSFSEYVATSEKHSDAPDIPAGRRMVTLGGKCVCHGSEGAVWERENGGRGFPPLGSYRTLAKERGLSIPISTSHLHLHHSVMLLANNGSEETIPHLLPRRGLFHGRGGGTRVHNINGPVWFAEFAATNIYQSVGSCTTTCNGEYAYAVIQNSQCWCSNYTPHASTQRRGCNSPCPGYPSDMCGGAGLYSYVLLNEGLISGTKGSESNSEVESEEPARPSSTSQEPSPSSGSTSATHSSSSTQSPVTDTTVGGVPTTVTIIPTVVFGTPPPEPAAPAEEGGMKGLAVVGIAIGCIAAVVLAALAVVSLVCYKKRQGRRDRQMIDDGGVSGSGWEGVSPASKDPFADASFSPIGRNIYERDRSGSIETLPAQTEQCLRITNPDPPEKS
ncbi:hypothetical protein EsHS_00006721 [Epichloe bromicola]